MNALFLLYINVREILFGRCLIDYKVRIGEWVLIFFFFFFVIGPTTVNVRVTGLTPGPHGFHLVSVTLLF